jgi:ribonuclease HII
VFGFPINNAERNALSDSEKARFHEVQRKQQEKDARATAQRQANLKSPNAEVAAKAISAKLQRDANIKAWNEQHPEASKNRHQKQANLKRAREEALAKKRLAGDPEPPLSTLIPLRLCTWQQEASFRKR